MDNIQGQNQENDLFEALRRKEAESKFQFDEDVSNVTIPDWIPDNSTPPNPQNTATEQETAPVNSLGKATSRIPTGMETGWKNIPVDILPSRGFGYPDGFELSIRAAEVSEIRHYSTIDESDRIDLDDKLNHILSKCMKIRWSGGFLEHLDLWYEDRFFVIMSIKDLTFIRGENRIMLPVTKNCKGPECNVPDMIELKSNILDSFVLDDEIIKRYNKDTYSFKFVPKDGSPEMELFIPTVGVTSKCRKILRDKANKGKKFDESFAKVATFIIPDWRDLDERVYDQYERNSTEWTKLQFAIADQMSDMINFATKSRIYSKCESCDGEITAEITFPGGYRSLFVISNIFEQLL